MLFNINDSTHQIVKISGLKGGATLHRFSNKAGMLYSAIYVGNTEAWSCERAEEQKMVRRWNKDGWKAFSQT